MPLSAQNLLWVKSVKNQGGLIWAYMDDNAQNEFPLHFSKHFQVGADRPRIEDIILLFQTIDVDNYKGTYLTHLVTPINGNGFNTGDPIYPRARWVKVIARANLPNPILKPNELIFFKPNRGACCSLRLIERYNGRPRYNGDQIPFPELQSVIWNLFDGYRI